MLRRHGECPGPSRVDEDGLRDVVAIGHRAVTRLMGGELLRRDVDMARSLPGVTLIAPGRDVHDLFDVDRGLIDVSIDDGCMRAADVVSRTDEEGCALTRQIVRLRRRIWQPEIGQHNNDALGERPSDKAGRRSGSPGRGAGSGSW